MTEPKRYQCRHIFTGGHRCGSPCLRGEDFCYYHHTNRRPVQDPRTREDRSAIQLAIGQILLRIAHNQIDSKRAGLLLYGLQIASTNLPRQAAKSTRDPREEAPQSIEEITTHPEQGLLAPPAELAQPEKRLSVIGKLLEDFRRDHPLREVETTQTTEILPTLQATAEDPTTLSVQIAIKPFRPQSALIRTDPRSLPQRRGVIAKKNPAKFSGVSEKLNCKQH